MIGQTGTAIVLCILAEPSHQALTLEEALSSYEGPIVEEVDTSTLHGKVMCGYQGWFMAKGDGFGQGFVHWGGVDQKPPRCSVDFWPDVSELASEERFPTNYKHGDGSTAYVFSSTVKKTVLRHFSWMKEYGIDGVFVQRFGSYLSDQENWNYRRACTVLSHCREGANQYGRAFAVMYDVGFDRGSVDRIMADWSRLIQEMRITRTPAYLKHRGRPVVSLWGYGFGHRGFDKGAARALFEFLKKPENGACTIMLGLPNDWVSWEDDRMELLKEFATIISPWNVGRYGSPERARGHFKKHWPEDIAFCEKHDKDYYAVVFPGFSWANLQKGSSPLNQIPRKGGHFFWEQVKEVKRYEMDMAYVAMFDEVDEGTAIFKCTNDPPVGRFCTYEGLPSDFYLVLTGLAGRLLRGEDISFPETRPDPKQQTYRPLSQLAYYEKPSDFSLETREKWRRLYQGFHVTLHQEPYSEWMTDLYDAKAIDIRLSRWEDIVEATSNSPLFVIGTGNESFNEGTTSAKKIVSFLKNHLSQGGTLLVLSSGRYPLFYPGLGQEAARFGFVLDMTACPKDTRIAFSKALAPSLEPWILDSPGESRLMTSSLYPDAKSYTPLASAALKDGTHLGDAIACVRPGGDLREGKIFFVAGDLLRYPDREKLLDALLRSVEDALP